MLLSLFSLLEQLGLFLSDGFLDELVSYCREVQALLLLILLPKAHGFGIQADEVPGAV